MSDTASTAAPPWARKCWSDVQFIYVEIPASDGGAPYILKYSHSENGLGKALTLLRNAHDRADRTNYTERGDDPRIKRATVKQAYKSTVAQRSDVANFLRKKGVIR